MKKKLFIAQQVPEFVRANYPAFLEFVQAYYEWFEEQYSYGKLGDLLNIDTTVDEFLQYFRKQIDVHGITSNSTNRLYLQHLKELYTAKGSSAAIKFLFKILYNTESNVLQPWDSVVKASQAEWSQPVSILTNDITADQAALLPGNKIIILDASGNTYFTYVTDIDVRRSGVIDVFINRIAPRDTLLSFKSYDETISGTILSSITSVGVSRSGSGFKPGQIFEVSDNSSVDSSLVKVRSVDSLGGITAVDVIKFGAGYAGNFTENFAPDQSQTSRVTKTFTFNGSTGINYSTGAIYTSKSFGAGDKVVFYNGGSGYVNLPGATGTDGVVSKGLISNTSYYVIPGTGTIKLASSYSNAVNSKYIAVAPGATGVVSSSMAIFAPDYATLSFNLGTQCVYLGRYKTGYDVVGNLAYLQDSYYYQKFSYVTSLDQTVDSYAALLKRALHPAGTKHFGNFEVRNSFQFDLSVETAPLKTIPKKDIIRDFITSFIESLSKSVTTTATDSANVSESTAIAVSKPISETGSTTTDSSTLSVFKAVSEDPISVAESSFTLAIGTAVSESVTFTVPETLTISATKSVTDSATATDTGGVSINLAQGTINDSATATDTGGVKLTPAPLFSDTLTITTPETLTFRIGQTLSETLNLNDASLSFSATTTLTDSVSPSETVNVFKGQFITLPAETANVSDSQAITSAKYVTDSDISFSESGTVYGSPYYTETPYITQYWENGYLLNETTITN